MTGEDVRASLIAQLQQKGADLPHFSALIDSYVMYFELEKAMKEDIRERGITYTTTSSTGKTYQKDNINVKLLPATTKMMLSILKNLGLTTEKLESEQDEDL